MSVKLKHRAYRHLRQELMLGRLIPGQKLSDAELAASLGISRTPVREALIQLEADGLVETRPPIGTYVKSLSATDARELLEYREALEAYAVEVVARTADHAVCVKLRSCCDQLMALARQFKAAGIRTWTQEVREQVVAADMAFHVVLIGAANNSRIVGAMKNTGILINLFRYQAASAPSDMLHDVVRTWRHHRRIYRAIKRGRPDEARRCVEAHLRLGRDEAIANEAKAQAVALPVRIDEML